MQNLSGDDKGRISPNFFDKIIEYFSPQRSLKRTAARLLLRQYAAAKTTRSTGGWTPVDQSVNDLIESSQQQVRARVRQLVRDFPYFSRAVTVLTDLVVGTGVDFQARVKLQTGKYNRKINDDIEYVVQRWSEKADLAGQLSFNELTRLSERGEIETGESLFILHKAPGRFVPFALQPIEPDRLATTYTDIRKTREIEGGIEYDKKTGEALFYHILDDGYLAKTEKIPASRIIHTFQPLRPGQMRGISPFTSAVLAADDLHQYLDATMDVAKLASKYLAIVTTPDGAGFQGLRTTTGDDGERIEELENAIIEYLRPGEQINFASHQVPNDTFDPFTKFILRMVAVGTGTSFELLSGDYSGLSYSNLKAIRADLVRGIKPRFDRRRIHFCQPVIEKVIESAVFAGRLNLLGYWNDPYPYHRSQWIWQGMESPDPLRETRAVVDEIKMGLKSPQEHVAARGRDLEEVLDELEEAKQMMEARGLTWGDVSLSVKTNPSAVDPKSSGDEGDRKIIPMRTRKSEDQIITRSLAVTPSSLNMEKRTVTVTMATENPVDVFHWDHGVVPEVLLMDGVEFPERIPLLDTHDRYSSRSVLGSVGGISIVGRELTGNVEFSKTAEDILTKVEEGHLTDFSIGYRVSKSVFVPEKESTSINGRSFDGPLLVTTRWKVKELSICPIGADENAKARAEANINSKGEVNMEEKLRKMLIARGLAENATDEQAWAFLDDLTRTEPAQKTEKKADPVPVVSLEDHVRAERERVTETLALGERFGMVEEARSAVKDGISLDAFRMKVFDLKMSQTEPTPNHRIEQGEQERDKVRAAMTDSILMRGNVTIEKAAPGAEDFMSFSLRELARDSLVRAGIRIPTNPMEMIGRAITHTTSDFPLVLANVANKSLFTGFDTAQETWREWCATGSVSDFKTHHSVRVSEASDLDEIPEAAEYKYGKRTEAEEQYKVVTYGKMFSITRQAIINDDLNALTGQPMAHGEAAARKIGDLPYAVLSANAAMGDTIALFHDDHSNTATNAAVAVASIAAGILAMKKQKDLQGLRRLNIRPQYYIGPVATEGTVEQFFMTNLIGGATNQTNLVNPYAGSYLTRIYESRIDDDSSTVWYLAGPKGKTITVFFLNGQQTPYMETKQGWSVDGIEYKVRIDAGAKAMDWRALYRNAGA